MWTFTSHHTKISSKQITDINLKLLKHDIRLQNDFLDTTTKAQIIKGKKDKLDSIKNVCASKDTMKEV